MVLAFALLRTFPSMVMEYSISSFFLIMGMWSVMMVAMMLPGAAPMILVFAAVNRKRLESGRVFVPVWIFLSGYLLVWIAVAGIAALIQALLHSYAQVSMDMKLVSPVASAIVLMSAGAYQFTKLKEVCLKNCQMPFDFITGHWREGRSGALLMGLHHGLYCVGCCWVLMLLLFAAGIMNLALVAAIAAFVLLEKAVAGRAITKLSGILLIAGGAVYGAMALM